MYTPTLDGGTGVTGVGVGATTSGDVVGVGIVVSVVVSVIGTETVVVVLGKSNVTRTAYRILDVPLGSSKVRPRRSIPVYLPGRHIFGVSNDGIVIVMVACD
jgi:L-aminopeptidase/D-esterase-like protein